MGTRHTSTCDDVRPAMLAATLTCARCTPGGTGLCREHMRKRRVMIRNSAARYAAMVAYAERLATVAGHGRDHVLDDADVIAPPTVSLREVL